MSVSHHQAKSYSHKMSANELIYSAEELSQLGKDEEALGMYKHWLNQSPREDGMFAVLFNYGWLLQKLNRIEEAIRAQNGLVEAYCDYLASQRIH